MADPLFLLVETSDRQTVHGLFLQQLVASNSHDQVACMTLQLLLWCYDRFCGQFVSAIGTAEPTFRMVEPLVCKTARTSTTTGFCIT